MGRTPRAELAADGESALARALESLGHRVTAPQADTGHDLTVVIDGIEVPVEIKALSVITPETAARIIDSTSERRGAVAPVAVGDLITAPAQDALRRAGWGWLDRRGHLVLRATGVHIDADVPPDDRAAGGPPPKPISGTAAISWAAALLMWPEDPPSMREVGRRVSISHSAIVAAAKRLRAASLTRSDGRPLIPELFWSLAEAWHPSPVGLVQEPPAGDVATYGALGVNLEGDGPGWAVAGTVGAVAWGAPAAIGSAYPPDFYVPAAADLRQATLRLGEASRFEERRCTVAIAPTPLACVERFDREIDAWGHWRFAHGLFAALDLAQDQARGVEILTDWDPKDFTRVW